MASEVSSVGGSGQTNLLSGALGASGRQLGEDAFLKLLVAQINHQDPLKPMDDTAFVAQLAQFSALEQALTTNQKLDFLALQQRGMANTEVAALVGKNVTVKGDKVRLEGSKLSVPVSFTLGDNAKTVTVTIKNEQGKTVRTMQVGEQSQGLVKVSWDGKDDNGIAQPAGTYTVTVEAKGATEAPVEVLQESTGVLQSVSFTGGYPVLELDNGVTAPASDLLRVNEQQGGAGS